MHADDSMFILHTKMRSNTAPYLPSEDKIVSELRTTHHKILAKCIRHGPGCLSMLTWN